MLKGFYIFISSISIKVMINYIMDFIFACNGKLYFNIRGQAEGTSYNIIYSDDAERNFQTEVEKKIDDFEKSLSVYDDMSVISQINRNEDVELDDYFITVVNKAKEISELTNGHFDISAEPLFRAWGFSSTDKQTPNKEELELLRQYVGMDKIILDGRKILKSHPQVLLNANAIAKGYSADIIADFFIQNGVDNFLIEIGGEIRLRGLNPDGELWRIGIDRPSENNLIPGQDIQSILQISDKAIATSGNYRQFYIVDGQKVPHTINPHTGYPVKHNLLSVTVIADDALTADAFATAFLVAGITTSEQWIKKYPYLDALFIYDEKGEYKVHYTKGIEKYILTF